MLREHSTPSGRIEAIEARLKAPPKTLHGVASNLQRIGALSLAHRLCRIHCTTFAEAFAHKSREKRPARARHHLIALLRWSTGLSFPDIASIFGCDHTTIIAAVERWDAELNS